MASIYGAKSGNGWQLRLDYTVTQNVAANQSTVSMTLEPCAVCPPKDCASRSNRLVSSPSR